MNERIKELAHKAEFIDKRPKRHNGNEWRWGYIDPELSDKLEKFAELIVRECIKESMDEIVPDQDIAETSDPLAREYLKGNNQGIVDAVVRFRNHFGVEE